MYLPLPLYNNTFLHKKRNIYILTVFRKVKRIHRFVSDERNLIWRRSIILPIFWGLDGVLLFMPVADVLTGIVSIWVITRTSKELSGNTTSTAVITEKRAKVNPDVKGIITIGRSYSSGGRTVGKTAWNSILRL